MVHSTNCIIMHILVIEPQWHLNTYNRKEDVLQGVRTLVYRPGRTNMAEAMATMRDNMFTQANGDRPDVPNIGIMVGDLIPTVDMVSYFLDSNTC